MSEKAKKYGNIALLIILVLSVFPLGSVFADSVNGLEENRIDTLSNEQTTDNTKALNPNYDVKVKAFSLGLTDEVTSELVISKSEAVATSNGTEVELLVKDEEIAKIKEKQQEGLGGFGVVDIVDANNDEVVAQVNYMLNNNEYVSFDGYGFFASNSVEFKIGDFEGKSEAEIKEIIKEKTGYELLSYDENFFVNEEVIATYKDNEVVLSHPEIGELKKYSVTEDEKSRTVGTRGKEDMFQVYSEDQIHNVAQTDVDQAETMANANLDKLLETATVVEVNNYDEFKNAYTQAVGNTKIVLNGVITLKHELLYQPTNTIVTIVPGTPEAKIKAEGNVYYEVFQLERANSILNLKDITLEGTVAPDRYETGGWNRDQNNSYRGLVYVSGNGSGCNLYGSTLVKNWKFNEWGGIVTLSSGTGTFANYYSARMENCAGMHEGVAGYINNSGTLRVYNFDVTRSYNGGSGADGGEGIWSVVEGGSNKFVYMYGGSTINNKINTASSWSEAYEVQLSASNEQRTNIYGNVQFYDNYEANEATGAIVQERNISMIYDPANPKGYSGNHDKMMEGSIFWNLTPESKVQIGQIAKRNMDGYYTYDGSPLSKKLGGWVVGRIEYSDPVLREKYYGNGVAEGILLDWNEPGTKLSNARNYSVVEKVDPDTNIHYAVLVRSSTAIEIDIQSEDGQQIIGEDGQPVGPIYYHTDEAGAKTYPIPDLSRLKYLPYEIRLESNVEVDKDTGAETPTNPRQGVINNKTVDETYAGFNIDENDTTFTYDTQNVYDKANFRTYRSKIVLTYRKQLSYQMLAKDALATSSEAQAATSNINNKLIEWMEANVKNLDANTNLDDPSKIVVVSANIDDIKAGTPGTYDVTFKFADDEAVSKTVKLTIVDDSYVVDQDRQTAYALTVQNHMISEAQAETITDAELINNMVVSATMINATDPQNPVDVKNQVSVQSPTIDVINNGGVTIHNVTFQVPSTAVKTADAKLTVRPNDSIPTDDQKGYIYAEDAKINSANKPATLNDLKGVMRVDAKYDGVDVTSQVTASSANGTDILAGTVGSYQVTWTLSVNGQTKTVTKMLTIVDDNTTCDDTTGVCIVAQDFSVELAEIVANPTITKDEIKTLAQVKAWSMTDGSDKTADVVLDDADYSAITSQTTAGTVSGVTFSVPSTSATKDVTATIIDNVNYTINADNFAVSVKDAPSLTADSVKLANYANVSVSPVGDVVDVTVDSTQLGVIQNAVVGQYPLTFTYNGVPKEIKVTVYDDSTNTDKDNDKDQANIFLTADSQVKLRTNSSQNNPTLKTVDEFNQDIPAATNAKAWLLDGRVAQVIEAPGSEQVLDQPGLYIVKLVGAGYNYETSYKDVYVTVVDDNTNCNDEVCISAQPIEILLSEASIYDEAMAKDRAKPIKAWYVNRPDAITQEQIKADASDIAIVNGQTTGTVLAGGQKFQVEGARPLTTGVDVTITEDRAGSFTITGQNLKYHQDQAKTLTEDQIKTAGIVSILNANNVDVTSAMLAQVGVDATQFAKITSGELGTHELKFTLNGSETTINVTVYNDDTTTDVPGDPDASSVFLNTDKYIELGTNSAAAQLSLPSVDEFNANVEGKLNVVASHSEGLDVTVSINPNTVPNTAGSYKLSVTATATDGKTAGPVEVVVLVKDENTICDGDVCLTAQNFNVNLAEIAAGTVDEAKIKQLAQVKGFDKQGNDRTADVVLDAADLAIINAQTQAGVVNDVTFTLGGASKDVIATIVDDVVYTINAQDFAVSVSDAQSLTSDSVKGGNYANVSLSPVGDVDNVQVNAGELLAIQNGVVGKYPLTFTYIGASKEINVTVYDDNTTVEPGKPGNESGIFLTSDTKVELGINKDAQSLGLTSVDTFNQDVVGATNAKSWLRDGTDATVVVVENPVVDQPGRYVVKLKGTNNAGLETDVREVTVIVKDVNTNCNDEVCISAQPIEILLSEAGVYDEAMAKDRAKPIKAWYVDKADVITQDQIKADASDIANVNRQTTATVLTNGQKFYVEGALPLTTGVDVTITEDVAGSFVINASNNIVLSSDEAKIATSDELRGKAGITITNANGVDVTAAMIDKVVANAAQLTAINTGAAQAYPLKFELNGSESNEIQVSVYDDNTATNKPNDKPNSELFLNADSPIELRTNNSTKYNTLPSVDEFNQDVLGLTNANAYHKDPNVNVTITPATATIADKAGRYTLTLTATATDGKTATKEIVIIVKDDNTSCNDKVCIVASDFAQNLTEVANLTEDEAKVKANVNAFYIDQAGVPTVSVNQTQLGAIQGLTQMPNTNPMDLTFSAEGLDAPVKVTIVDNNYTLSANDFNVNASDLPLDEAGVVNNANATATNNTTGQPGTVKVDQASLDTLNATTEGVVDVTLYVDEQPTVRDTIKVNVVPEGAVVGDKATIAADSPIEINLSDVLKGDKDKLFDIIKNKANARAWYNDGTKPDPTIIYDENQMNNILAQQAPVSDLDFTFIVDGDNKAKKPIKVNIVDDTTITLPGQDDIPGTSDDVVVKPNPDDEGNYPSVKPDGSVDLPNGGDITFPNNPDNNGTVTVPGGSTVAPDGDVTTPEGDVVRPNPDGTIELPGNDGDINNKPDNPVIKPGGNGDATINPDGSVTPDDDSQITYPNNPNNPGGSTTVPGGSTINPDGSVTLPGADKPAIDTDEDGTITLPGQDDELGTDDDVAVKPDGGNTTVNPDGSITPDNDSEITFPNNPGNDDITQIPGGSTVKPDGTVETPEGGVVRPNPDGGVELPGNDGKLPAPDNVDNPLIKPEGDGPIVVNPDGSVTLPDDEKGEITYPNNPDNNGTVSVPGGSTVSPDGSVTLPGGNKPAIDTDEDGTITLPGQDDELGTDDDVAVKPDGGNTTVNPDGSVTPDNDSEITFPNNPDNDDITQIPGGSTVKPDGTVELPNGGVVRPNPDGGVELPGNDGKLPAPDNVDNPLIKPEGDGPIVVNPDGTVTLPDDENGNITYPNNPDNNGTITIPGGSTVSPDGVVTTPEGGKVDTEEDGSIKVPGPNGNLGDEDDVVVKPGGNGDATINPDGSVTLPNGGTITPDNGTGKEWEVPNGTIVKPDGSIVLPGNNPNIDFEPTIRPNGDGSISVPGKDGVFDENGDNDHKVEGDGITFDPVTGDITMPNGGTVTRPGGEVVTVPNGTIVRPDGTIIQPAPEMNNVPVITIKDSADYTYDKDAKTITINQFTPFDVAQTATANDVEDGDLTDELVINVTRTKSRQTVNGNVDTSIAPSEWLVQYSVTDSKGATARKEITVIVIKDAQPPVINGTKDYEITVGSDLDLMAGVSANDYEGNDITANIIVTVTDPNGKVSNDINTMIIGTHTVEYSVTDKNGLTTTVTQTVTVKPIVLPGEDDIPGTDDDVIVTPNPDGDKPTTDGDGNVTLPDGGDVEFPGGGGVEVPDDSVITPGGEVIVPGGDNKPGTDDDVVIKPIPPTDEKPNGSVELPGDDGDINTKPDNPVVTPQGPNKPVIKPDGGVELPDGGDIEYPFNPDNPGGSIVVPPGSVVTPDGTVETPEGGKVDTDEDGTITLPGQDGNLGTDDDVQIKPGGNGDVTINPDGSVDLPNGGDITFPNNPDNNGTVTVPGGSTVAPDGTITTPEGGVVKPNPDGTVELPGQDGNLGTDDDVIIKPGGNGDVVVNPDGSVDLPNGGDVSFPNKPDAGMEVPGGSNVGQDGTVTAPNGDQSRPNVDGTITVPGHDGQFGTEDDGIIKPNGPNKPVLNPDGTITLPDGGSITFPGLSDCEIEILPGGYVASTGVVTNPGADGIINTADDEVLDPAVVCSIEVTEPQQPTKPTNTGAMNNMIMLLLVVAVSSVVVIGLRRRK